MDTINFGILGASNISSRSLVQAAQNISNINVLAVASRDLEKAKNYAEINNIPNYFSRYIEILESKEINAVYIPLINSLHAEWVIKSIKAGKHVLIEKPLCLNKKECAKIKETLERNKVILFEAVMIQHHPVWDYLNELIAKKVYGHLKSFHTQISVAQNESNNYRFKNINGAGAFYDFSTYWLLAVQKLLGLDYKSYNGESYFNGPNNIDTDFKASLMLKSGIECYFKCSFEHQLKADFSFYFEDYIVEIKNFLRPAIGNNVLIIKIKCKNSSDIIDKVRFEPQSYYTNQLVSFAKAIRNKQSEISIEESFARIELIEKIYQSAKEKSEYKIIAS